MKERVITITLALVLLIGFTLAETLEVTEEHPFLQDGEWIPARDLVVGDTFKTLDGKTAVIKKIKLVEPDNPFFVFNLEVPLFKNFIVTLENLIVHNSNREYAGLSDELKTRIDKGDFTPEEISRIQRARSLLSEDQAKLLENSEVQKELLKAHYSGNTPDGKNSMVFRGLYDKGLTRESIETLASEDNMILGVRSKNTKFLDDIGYDSSRRIYDYTDETFDDDLEVFISDYGGHVYMDDPEMIYAQIRNLDENIGMIYDNPTIRGGKLYTQGDVLANGNVEKKLIWVIDTDGNLRLGNRANRQHFLPHTSLADGGRVFGAGEIIIENGRIIGVNAKSGHYAPKDPFLRQKFSEDTIDAFKKYLKSQGMPDEEISKIKFEAITYQDVY